MKTIIAVLLLLPALCFAGTTLDYIWWGYGGVNRAKEWVSPDGRMDLSNLYSNASTAVDYWATPGTVPILDSISEITLHRNTFGLSYDERLNVSAMADGIDNGAYRVGVERIGSGQFHPILFCFENVTPGVAFCPLKLDTTGAYVNVGGVWKAIAYVP